MKVRITITCCYSEDNLNLYLQLSAKFLENRGLLKFNIVVYCGSILRSPLKTFELEGDLLYLSLRSN